jgi:hypothetical protein
MFDAVPEGARRPRTRRGLGVLGVLAVAAGFAGGFAAGYAAHDQPSGDAVEAVANPATEDAGGDASAATAERAETAGAAVATTAAGAGADQAAPPVPQRLFRRDTVAGLSVRVFRSEVAVGVPDCGEGVEWCPPPECNPAAYLEVIVVGEWSVAHGGAPAWDLRDGPARVLGTVSDYYSAEPMFGVLVRTSATASSVRLSLGDQHDEMAPVDGLAALAVADPGRRGTNIGGYPEDAVVEVVDGGAPVEVPIIDVFRPDPACIAPPPAPPTLPAPGEQPADPGAARDAVTAVFQQAFGGDDADANARAVDDPSGLEDLRRDLRERYPDMLGGRVSYEITDIVFTSPTEAAFYFRPVITDYTEMPRQIGHARVVGGEWKVTRATVCAMFQLGGAAC